MNWKIEFDPLRLMERPGEWSGLEAAAREQGEDILQAVRMAPNGKPQVLDLGWYRTFYTINLVEARGASVDAEDWAEPKEKIRCDDLHRAMATLRQLMV